MKGIARNVFYFICFWFLATAFVDDPYSTDQSVAYWIVAAAFVLWIVRGICSLVRELQELIRSILE